MPLDNPPPGAPGHVPEPDDVTLVLQVLHLFERHYSGNLEVGEVLDAFCRIVGFDPAETRTMLGDQ